MLSGLRIMREAEIPVFIFTGFLDAGKTTFIQGTLEDERFNNGIKTLLVVCEEGEEEYDFSAFAGDNVTKVVFEDEELLTPDRLEAARKRSGAERVMVEYNGMWNIDSLFRAFPENWVVAQELTFADAVTYPSYNANMRSLVFDKLKTCDVVMFNRMSESVDKLELHKIVRSVGRNTEIMYDWGDDRVEVDDIEDPLPFDVDAPVIEIGDRDYALWYADMMEDLSKYDGKRVKFKAFLGNDKSLPKDAFLAGRHVMACCAEDIQFAGLLCYWKKAQTVATGTWAVIEADISMEKNKVYKAEGPVLRVTDLEFCSAPEEEVVTYS